MKAAVINQKKLEIWDVPMPELGPYDALCEMEYGATCAGTDLRLIAGGHPTPVFYPTILGHESVGRVVKLGSKVRNYKIGDLVSRVGAPSGLKEGLSSNWGGFASFGIAKDHWEMARNGIPCEEWDRYRVNQIIPPEISPREAPMIITWRETLSYIHHLGINSKSRVLVIGSGANALAMAVHAYNLRADVYVVGSECRRETFNHYHIAGYYNYKSTNLIATIQDDRCIDIDYIVDGVGDANTVNQVLPLLVPGGCIGIYGWNDRRTCGINPFLSRGSFRIYNGGYDEEEATGDVLAMIRKGQLNASDWYDQTQPLAFNDIAQAYESLRRHEAIKYLIDLK